MQPYYPYQGARFQTNPLPAPAEVISSRPIGQLIERVKSEAPPHYIFRGVVYPSVGVFYGPAKSGKTVLAECMLMHIASGTTEFLNQPLFIPHQTVLMIGMEEFYRNLIIRNDNQITCLTDKLDLDPSWIQRFHVVDDTFPRYLHAEAQWDPLNKEIDRLHRSGAGFNDSTNHRPERRINRSTAVNATSARFGV